MGKRLHSWLGALLALTLSVGLVGCGSTKQEAATTATGTSTDSKPAATTPAAPIEISFWHGMATDNAQGKTLNAIIDKFNSSQSKYKVTGVYQGGYKDLNTKLLAAATAGNLPVMSQLTDDMMAKMAGAKAIMQLDSFVSAMKPEDIKDFAPSMLEHGKVGGHYYGWPFNKSTVELIYDKKLIPNPPKTAQEFIDMAKAATKGDTVSGTAFPITTDTFSQFFLVYGGEWLSADGKSVGFNSPAGVQALQTIVDLVKSKGGYAMKAGTYQSNIFNEGKAAMVATTSASLSYVAQGSNGKREWAAAPMFAGTSDRIDASGTQLGITAAAKPEQQQGAWEFIQFLTNADNMAEWAIQTGYLPLRESSKNVQAYKDAVAKNPNLAVAPSQLSRVTFQPALAQWFDIRAELDKAVQGAVNGTDPKAALDAAAQKANALLNK